MKFSVKNGNNCNKVFRILKKTFGDNIISQTWVYKWYKCFQEGQEVFDDNTICELPSTSISYKNMDKVIEIVLASHRVTFREVTEELGF